MESPESKRVISRLLGESPSENKKQRIHMPAWRARYHEDTGYGCYRPVWSSVTGCVVIPSRWSRVIRMRGSIQSRAVRVLGLDGYTRDVSFYYCWLCWVLYPLLVGGSITIIPHHRRVSYRGVFHFIYFSLGLGWGPRMSPRLGRRFISSRISWVGHDSACDWVGYARYAI